MGNLLVVDFRIAAANRAQYLDDDFSWPVSQNDYDEPLLEFVNWVQQLPGELALTGRELAGFQIAEPDLLKDVASIVGTWMDICAAQVSNLTVQAGDDQALYQMMLSDSYPEFSPTTEMRATAERSANSPLRTIARSVRSVVNGVLGTSSADSYILSGNELTRQICPPDAYPIKQTYRQIASSRSTENPPARIGEIADLVFTQLSEILSETSYALAPGISGYLSRSIRELLIAGWRDSEYQLGFKPKENATVFTGTGGGYVARVITSALSRRNVQVNRSTHGGDTPLFDDPMWPSLEVPFSTTYSTYGPGAANRVNEVVNRFCEHRPTTAPHIVARGSKFHSRIVENAPAKSGSSNVYVVSASFNKLHRAIPHIKIHDVVYLEWHRRLLSEISKMGFRVRAKRHPKGTSPELILFEGTGAEELINIGMAGTFADADVYVLDIAGSAFIEAMCTLKPVVLIDIPNRRMTDAARQDIAQSAQIVKARFTEKNTVDLDFDELRKAIEMPVNLEERHKFVEAYLTGRTDN